MALEDTYPSGRLSMKVSNIRSLLPPSEARPACISTAMASTTWRSLPTEVAHASSNSLTSATARPQRRLLLTLWATITAAIAHVATAQAAASPSPAPPISHSPIALLLITSSADLPRRRKRSAAAVTGAEETKSHESAEEKSKKHGTEYIGGRRRRKATGRGREGLNKG